MQDSVFKLKKK